MTVPSINVQGGARLRVTLTTGGGAARGNVTLSGLTMTTARLLGRSTAGTGAIEEITLGTNLSFSGTTLNATGGGGGGGTNLGYTPSTRVLTSDTGTDVTLPLADGTDPGLMASAGFTKLAGIATGATANSADATLLNRSNHTGTQALGTISGLGTGVATALGVNVGSAGAPVLFGGALGTPSAGTLTNCTGYTFANVASKPTTISGYGITDGVTLTGTETLTNKTLGSISETTFTITDAAAFAINPNNGPIQTVTLGADRTPVVASFDNGQSVKLKIAAAGFSITWTTIGVVWISSIPGSSGEDPVLGATGFTHIELWREGAIYHGSFIGYTAT